MWRQERRGSCSLSCWASLLIDASAPEAVTAKGRCTWTSLQPGTCKATPACRLCMSSPAFCSGGSLRGQQHYQAKQEGERHTCSEMSSLQTAALTSSGLIWQRACWRPKLTLMETDVTGRPMNCTVGVSWHAAGPLTGMAGDAADAGFPAEEERCWAYLWLQCCSSLQLSAAAGIRCRGTLCCCTM